MTYSENLSTEEKGMIILRPFLGTYSDDGRFVIIKNGPHAEDMQQSIGDVFVNRNNEFLSVEIKVEEKHTGWLFLEIWSNRNLDFIKDHAKFGSNLGWMFKCRADFLFYYFLDLDILYVVNLFELKRWAFGYGEEPGNIYKYVEKRQNKTKQLNDSWGRAVNISDIRSGGVTVTTMRPKAVLESMEIEF